MTDATSKMVKRFQRKPCNRCDGGGRYSWNAVHGSMCYGCNGKGYNYTDAGLAAHEIWLSIARPEIAVEDVQPGMKLRVSGMSKTGAAEVESVEPDKFNAGMLIVRFVPGSIIGSHGAYPGHMFRLAKTAESHRAAWDAVADHPGVEEVAADE